MKPEQLKWTDKEWASHLQWDVQDIPSLRKWMTENYFPQIVKISRTGNFAFHMTKLDIAPSGAKRIRTIVSSDKEFESFARAAQYANQEILPRMEFSPFVAKLMGVPTRALQMLHIHEKQK